MFNQIFPYLTKYLSLVISIIGFGSSLLGNLEKKNKIYNFNIGYIGLVGIFFLPLNSYFSSFYSHSQIHNSFFFFIGLILFFKNFALYKKREINILIFFFLILFIGIIYH